jgi:hypothetical protein
MAELVYNDCQQWQPVEGKSMVWKQHIAASLMAAVAVDGAHAVTWRRRHCEWIFS